VFVAATVVLGVSARLTVDDGIPRARAWMEADLPADARVATTGRVADLAFLPRAGWGEWADLVAMRDNDAQYVLTQNRLLEQGHGSAAPQTLAWLEAHARAVFTTYGPTSGDVVVWQLDRAQLDAAVAAGHNVPPLPADGWDQPA
jgi:hypothetical protein